MIAQLNGKLSYVSEDIVVVDVGGVGYAVRVTPTIVSNLPKVGSPVRLYTYLQVKDDGLTLYGFNSTQQRELFELLLSVSGVGPKVAQSIVSALPLNTLLNALLREDVVMLTQIPGVGAKLAQRLAMELSEKVGQLSWHVEEREVGGVLVEEATEALLGLGYTPTEAKRAASGAVRRLGAEATLEAVIREALRRLGG
ncbi:MAG TPA: Holliday junction branch migration protein RuvA [Armatimonadetes bacterium]|nr:Holliday junction branch migration protein RuvA [Armatimonadota bacterium]